MCTKKLKRFKKKKENPKINLSYVSISCSIRRITIVSKSHTHGKQQVTNNIQHFPETRAFFFADDTQASFYDTNTPHGRFSLGRVHRRHPQKN
jgi:hypothetical protein